LDAQELLIAAAFAVAHSELTNYLGPGLEFVTVAGENRECAPECKLQNIQWIPAENRGTGAEPTVHISYRQLIV
jgi:hypothetical protein